MANIASSKKDAKRSAVRAQANRSVRSAVKTQVTKVRRALTEGEKEVLPEVLSTAVSALDRAAAKGILHRNNAARRKARLLKRVNAAGSAQPEAVATKTKAPAKKAPASKATSAPRKTAKASASKKKG